MKNYKNIHGPFAWLADIEINKGPYLISFVLLVLGIILVRQPFFEITPAFTEPTAVTLHEIDGLNKLEVGAIILNVISILALLVPMLKFFEWKYRWFIPTVVSSLIECVISFYLINKKNEIYESTLIGLTMKYLSIDVTLTKSACILLTTFVLTLICGLKMLIDVKNNQIIY